MHMDPLLPGMVASLWVVVLLALVGRRLGQPMPVVYILAGVALGPFGLGILDDSEALAHVGEYGVILLLFLLGTEIRLERLLASWRTPVLGLVLQVTASVVPVALVGSWLEWPLGRTVLIGFAISLSSTAVVLRLLDSHRLTESELGADVLAILLAQDLAVAPMVVVIGLLGGHAPSAIELSLQGAGALVLLGAVGFAARRGRLEIPFADTLESDGDLQVFAGLLFALTVALFASLAGLSAAFGAFVAGVLVGASAEAHWIHERLHPCGWCWSRCSWLPWAPCSTWASCATT